MDMRWSAILLLGVVLCLSWIEAPPRSDRAARTPPAAVAPARDVPAGVVAVADDLSFTRKQIEDFLA